MLHFYTHIHIVYESRQHFNVNDLVSVLLQLQCSLSSHKFIEFNFKALSIIFDGSILEIIFEKVLDFRLKQAKLPTTYNAHLHLDNATFILLSCFKNPKLLFVLLLVNERNIISFS